MPRGQRLGTRLDSLFGIEENRVGVSAASIDAEKKSRCHAVYHFESVRLTIRALNPPSGGGTFREERDYGIPNALSSAPSDTDI
jgi:hypothetical protein